MQIDPMDALRQMSLELWLIQKENEELRAQLRRMLAEPPNSEQPEQPSSDDKPGLAKP